MPTKKNACEDCIYFGKYYGKKDKLGNAMATKGWCVSRQSFLKRCPKQCDKKKTKFDIKREVFEEYGDISKR